jgi:hypothetical protein
MKNVLSELFTIVASGRIDEVWSIIMVHCLLSTAKCRDYEEIVVP